MRRRTRRSLRAGSLARCHGVNQLEAVPARFDPHQLDRLVFEKGAEEAEGVGFRGMLLLPQEAPSEHEGALAGASPSNGVPRLRKPANEIEGKMAATNTKKLTKAQVILALSEQTELSKKDVSRVFEALSVLVAEQLVGRGAPGEVTIPGLFKLKAVKKPATKEREGINPFTKEPITIAAKPASKKVKAIPTKALKEMVQ